MRWTTKLKGKRVLLTGAAGFIGSRLAQALTEWQVTLHGIVTPATRLHRLSDVSSQMTLWKGDLRDSAFVREVMNKVQPQIVYHLADYGIQPGDTDLLEMASVNVGGLANLLEALRDISFECLVTSGSSAEYGPKDRPMEEEQVLQPETFYGATKAAGTLLSQAFGKSQKRKIIALRLFYVYGPGEEPTRFVSTAIRSCLEGAVMKIASLGEKRDFVFVEDVVGAYLLAACAEINTPQIINIGTSVESTLKQAIRVIEQCTGKELRYSRGAYENRPWRSPCWSADIHKAEKVLGWKPAHDLEAGVRKTVAWVSSELRRNM